MAATASYEYDALGRLTRVGYSDGKRVIYRLDAAGNRTQVTSGTPAGVPASITVPSGSTSGSYTDQLGRSDRYGDGLQALRIDQLELFGTAVVHTGTGRSAALSGRGNGTYYYRVRACFDTECGAYRTGSNGVTVTITARSPASRC